VFALKCGQPHRGGETVFSFRGCSASHRQNQQRKVCATKWIN